MILGFSRKESRAFPSGNLLAVVLEVGRRQISPHAPKLLLRRVLWSKRSYVSACAEGTIHTIQADPLCLGVRVFGKELSHSQHLSSALQECFRNMDSSWSQPLSYDLRDLIKLITSATYQKWMRVRIAPHILFFEEVLLLCSLLFSLSWKDLCPKRPFIPTDSKTF